MGSFITDGLGDDTDAFATTSGYVAVALTFVLFLSPVETCLKV